MDEAELVGGALYGATDPVAQSLVLAELLISGVTDSQEIRQRGFEPALVESVRRALAPQPAAIELACTKGAAWVLGRRSGTRLDSWELVVTLPAHTPLPQGLRRTTAETLILLAAEAEHTLRFVAPFLDPVGIGFLTDAIAAATARGVSVEVFEPTRSELRDEVVSLLWGNVNRAGDLAHLTLVQTKADAPWPHLKVMVADGSVAYVGSANITSAGLAGRNLELGVLVRGPQVAIVERVLDLYRSEG